MIITTHAKQQWLNRAEALGLNASMSQLENTLARAKPQKNLSRFTRLHLCKRTVMNAGSGHTYFKVADGWRFVIVNGKCVTAERIRPHENYWQRYG